MNIYKQFIQYLKKEEKKLDFSNKNLEKHHILSLHAGGLKEGPVIICNAKNHTLAHYYRYLAFKETGDLVAFQMRWNQKIGVKERASLAVKKNKELKNIFWDPNWQSIQGKKSLIKQKENKNLFYDSKLQSKQAKKAGLKNTKK